MLQGYNASSGIPEIPRGKDFVAPAAQKLPGQDEIMSKALESIDMEALFKTILETNKDSLRAQSGDKLAPTNAKAWHAPLESPFGSTANERLQQFLSGMEPLEGGGYVGKLQPPRHGLEPLTVAIDKVTKEDESWEGYAANFEKHAPEGYKNPSEIHVVQFRTSPDLDKNESLAMVGCLSDQGAAYVGNLDAGAASQTKWTGSDFVQAWDNLILDIAPDNATLQDTAHINKGMTGKNENIELTTRFMKIWRKHPWKTFSAMWRT